MHTVRPNWLWVIPCLLLAAALATPHLAADLFWFDEMIQLERSTGAAYGPVDFAEVLENVRNSRSWPPVHSFVAAAWGAFTGWAPLATRYSSLLAGMLSIALLYRLGRDMHSHRVGLVAALLLSGSAFFIYYLHEFRGYTLFVLFSVSSVWFYWRVLNTDRHRQWMRLGLFVSLLLLIHTHYGATFTAIIIGVYHLLLAKPRNRVWLVTLVVIGLAAVAYLPWLFYALGGVVERELAEPRGLPPLTALWELGRGFSNELLPVTLLAIGYALYTSDDDDRAVLLLMTWLFLGAILMLGLNQYVQFMFHIRHIIALMLPLYLLIGIGLVALPSRVLIGGVVVLWLGLGVVFSLDFDFMTRLSGYWRTIDQTLMDDTQATLDTCVSADDAVVFLGPQDDPATERLAASSIAYTLGDTPYKYAQINNLLDMTAYTPGGAFLEFFDDYAVAYADLAGDAPRLWVMGLHQPTRDHFFAEEFQSLANDQYDYCGRIESASNPVTYVYSQAETVTCNDPVRLPPCTDTLLNRR